MSKPGWKGSRKTLSADETFRLGQELGAFFPSDAVLALYGDLAAGKTTFIRGVATSLGIDPKSVQSPTFTYLNIYEGSSVLFHFDLYRLEDAQQFLSMGFDEYFEQEGVVCIEWAERIRDILPDTFIGIELNHLAENQREIKWE